MTYIIPLTCSEFSLAVVLLGVHELERYITDLEVHATVKDPALKIMQRSVLIFKMSELDSSSP